MANGERVADSVTLREALVGHVEEGEELLLLDNVADLLPLLRRRVDTGRVVGASMEENDSLVVRFLWGTIRIL